MQSSQEDNWEDLDEEELTPEQHQSIVRQGALLALGSVIFVALCTIYMFRDQLLIACCESGHTTLARILLACGANVRTCTAEGDTALHQAPRPCLPRDRTILRE